MGHDPARERDALLADDNAEETQERHERRRRRLNADFAVEDAHQQARADRDQIDFHGGCPQHHRRAPTGGLDQVVLALGPDAERVLARRDANDATKPSIEMALIVEAAIVGDVGRSTARSEKSARSFHAKLHQIFVRREAELTAKSTNDVSATEGHLAREIVERDVLGDAIV